MSEPEFDQYAARYDQVLGETIPDSLNENGYFAEYKIALMARLVGHTEPKRILDFGCGAGRSLPHLRKYFPDAELWGYDVSAASLEVAAGRVPGTHLRSEWRDIPNTYFDGIFAANVFHHIPLADRQRALTLCRNVLSGGGQMFLFEHNPFNPATRWIFDRCPFDVGAKMLSMRTAMKLSKAAGFTSAQHGYTLFFPRPLAYLRGLEPLLRKFPLGAQYYVQLAK